MPSFLSKVFGRKDDKDSAPAEARNSDGTLLDGKFEVVSPPVSPIAPAFNEGDEPPLRGNTKDRFTLFRLKSRTSDTSIGSPKLVEDVPHLILNLPGAKESPSPSFDPDTQLTLSDTVVGDRRLSPQEALVLVRACSQWMTERGKFIILFLFFLPFESLFLLPLNRPRNSRSHASALALRLT